MSGFNDALEQAVGAAVRGDWEPLRTLVRNAERIDAERSAIRHDLGNLLSIAQSNVEGIIDGVLENTPERLGRVAQTLAAAGELLARQTEPHDR